MNLTDIKERIPWTMPVMKQIYSWIKGMPPITKQEITKEMIRELVDKPDPVIMEIGSNNGNNTKWFLEVFENPTIYCFEPDPRAVARFRKNIGEHPNVILNEIALSDREGEITFHQSGMKGDNETGVRTKEWDASGSIRPPLGHLEKHPNITFENSITVRTCTLDKFCEEHGIDLIDFIWMDVQGAEIDVFNGGKKTLFQNTRYLYSEYALSEMFKGQIMLPQMLRHLKGFKVLDRFPGDVLLENRNL